MLTKKKNFLAFPALATLALAASLAIAGVSVASEGGANLENANNDVANTASLQRGARNVVNYCYGCHSAQYVRFNRVAADLGLNEEQLKDNLMFTGVRPSDQMKNAMAPADAERWFGRQPPDLSLLARSKGTAHIYTFLKSFYVDPSRPTGVNNMVVPNVAMPNVVWELQGIQKAVYEGVTDKDGNVQKHFTRFEPVTTGVYNAEEFDQFVRDTVNFLDYIGEPMQLQRRSLGMAVMAFLLVFFGFAYFLKQEYWKDVK